MPASIISANQALAGCDRLTISPALLDELAASEGVLTRQLTPGCVTETRPSPMTQAEFLWQHHQDPMAVERLAEGIRLFAVESGETGTTDSADVVIRGDKD